MFKEKEREQLADKHYVTLVLRLLIDQQGQLHHGVMLDLNKMQVGKFQQLTDLPNLVASWVQSKKNFNL